MVSGSGDFKKIEDVVRQISKKEIGTVETKVSHILGGVAKTIARSWRARVSTAPYGFNGKSRKKGRHTRSGGVPLERSIKVEKATRRKYLIKVVDMGGNAPEHSKPSAYANYDSNRYGPTRQGRPYFYKQQAILTGLARLRSLLNKI